MKVALDATPLTERNGGIRRYTIELINSLARCFPQDEYLLVSDQSYQHPALSGMSCCRVESRRYWLRGLPRFLREEGVHLFHGTDFSAPYQMSCPSVLTLHDLSPWLTGASARVRRRTPWLLRFGLATMVITPSEAIRRAAIDFFHLSPEEVVAIPLAAGASFRPIAGPKPTTPYFLFAGSDNPRKNYGTVREAYEALRRRGYAIELRSMGEIAEEDLPALYSQAVAVLYPSSHEGFGLPVLEAMQCGAPVVTSRDAALLETSGGCCLNLDPHDPKSWLETMEALLTQPRLRHALSARGLKRARDFSWERTARQTREVYATAMRRFHG